MLHRRFARRSHFRRGCDPGFGEAGRFLMLKHSTGGRECRCHAADTTAWTESLVVKDEDVCIPVTKSRICVRWHDAIVTLATHDNAHRPTLGREEEPSIDSTATRERDLQSTLNPPAHSSPRDTSKHHEPCCHSPLLSQLAAIHKASIQPRLAQQVRMLLRAPSASLAVRH